MIGYCNRISREVLSEADCYYCKDTDLTLCRYWNDNDNFSKIKELEKQNEELIKLVAEECEICMSQPVEYLRARRLSNKLEKITGMVIDDILDRIKQ